MQVTDYIPAALLYDARRVLAAQDPDVSALARQWQHMPAWRAAMKIAAAEQLNTPKEQR